MMPERLSRSVDADLNDALKVAEDFLVHLPGLIVNGSSVHRFHHAVRCPTAPLHDVLIRDPDGVHDAGGVMPLRYNYDKPEKPRRIKGFEVFSLIFSSFSKPKNHTEISRIIGGVSLTTNE